MTKKEIKNLDSLWSQIVKLKAGRKCESCGKFGVKVCLNACHIVGRRYRTTRWGAVIDGKYDLCGFSGCFTCHMQYDEHGPLEKDIREKVIGNQRYDKIRNLAVNSIADNQDYDEIRSQLKEVEHEYLKSRKNRL